MAASVQIRALQKAVELGGKAEVPRAVLLRAVELIIDELPPEGGASEPGDPPAPRTSASRSRRDCD